jgi:hypothetical protein
MSFQSLEMGCDFGLPPSQPMMVMLVVMLVVMLM